MPSGGKKGGAIFPRFNLDAAITAAKRLVSKSHSASVPRDIYFSGVLQVSGPRAEVKSSSIKQYGFLLGNAKDGFSASPLAKQVAMSEGPERTAALKQAALSPKVFKGIFDAFHGDTVAKSRLKQRAGELNIHPDMLEMCVKIYLDSLTAAGLVSVNGDQITHLAEAAASPTATVGADDEEGAAATSEEIGKAEPAQLIDKTKSEGDEKVQKDRITTRTGRALINVNISLDSSLDIDKLAKQLELLKKFGAI
jgi:hypothetical protein